MTLVGTIIEDAFRETDYIGETNNITPPQAREALRKLNQVIKMVYGDEAGEALQDWPLGNFGRESPLYDLQADEYRINRPTINRRLIAVNDASKTVYLSLMPQDGARMGIADPYGRLATVPVTLDGNGRTIEGQPTITVNTNGANTEWFYRADLGEWVRLTDLQMNDEMPFPAEFDIFFTLLLALRINPSYKRSMDPQSQVTFQRERTKFIARYLQSMPLEILDDISWPFMSTQSYDQQREFSSERAFNRGGYFWRG